MKTAQLYEPRFGPILAVRSLEDGSVEIVDDRGERLFLMTGQELLDHYTPTGDTIEIEGGET